MRKHFISTVVVLLVMAWIPGVIAAPLEGDKEAIALVDRMLETLGGKAAWARARTITIELTGYYAREKEPWEEIFWMELDTPRGRFELKGGDVDRVVAWTPEQGWELNKGDLETLDSERHKFEMEYWKRQPVVIFHRLAQGVPATRVKKGDNEYRFDVFDAESGTLLAQFAVNKKGEPIKWGSSIGEQEFEHFFGPLASYKGARLPQWGGSISGVWRYEHKSAALTASPPAVSYDPPSVETKKQAGAGAGF